MHRLPPKGPIPNELQTFCRDNPVCNKWDVFYNNYSESYKRLKLIILSQQGGLCAYCEEKLPQNEPSLQRVEHFHPKEDVSSTHNWAFDWNNMIVTCHGGSREDDGHTDSSQKKAKRNTELHCDASKEQYITPERCEGYLLNPLTMPVECLFSLDRRTGELQPNDDACRTVTVQDNHFDSVPELVRSTIEILNLNCNRLNEKRRKVIQEFERQRKSLRQNSTTTTSIRESIAMKWFGNNIPSFYTTRRILLGKYAENVITR